MSFHLTAQNIRVEGHHYLVGELQNEDGNFNESSIDLDELLGNDNGPFRPAPIPSVPFSVIITDS